MVGILFLGDLKYCPYIRNYIEILKERHIEYEIVSWQRSGEEKKQYSNSVLYKKESKLDKSPIFKVWDFICYSKFLNKHIAKRKYEKIIVLTTLVAYIILPQLVKYRKRYILDIRDISFEYNIIFRIIESKIIKNAYKTFISSEGFKEILPKAQYELVDNITFEEIRNRKKIEIKKAKDIIKVIYLGVIRDYKNIKMLMDNFGNDYRFVVIFYGDGPALVALEEYLSKKKYNNIKFKGYYDNSIEIKNIILNECDILLNHYALNNNIKLCTSNKFYDGIFHGIPQLVNIGSFEEKNIKKYGVGISLSINDPYFNNKIYDYYHSIDWKQFRSGIEKAQENILIEMQQFESNVNGFLNL